jgi:hypothetical protein
MLVATVALALDGVVVAQTDKMDTDTKVVGQLNDEKLVFQRGARFMYYKMHDKAPPELISNSSIWKLYNIAWVSDAGVSARSALPTMAVNSSGDQIVRQDPHYIYDGGNRGGSMAASATAVQCTSTLLPPLPSRPLSRSPLKARGE